MLEILASACAKKTDISQMKQYLQVHLNKNLIFI